MGVLLEVKNLGISFGGLRAVDGLNMTINEGALVGLIGPNGAGKTTAFNMVCTGRQTARFFSMEKAWWERNRRRSARRAWPGLSRTFVFLHR